MTSFVLIIILALVLALAVFVVLWLIAAGRAKKLEEKIGEIDQWAKSLISELDERNELIQKLQEAERDYEKAITKMRSGADDQRFAASLDVLSDLARRRGEDTGS